jgi:hypothetical protein
MVGAIADRLIAGSPAANEVNTILQGSNLQQAAIWADCAKGINPKKDFVYQGAGRYPECGIYETPDMEAEMSDYVRRNNTNCNPKPDEESCHKQYHYTDIAIQHDRYDSQFVGARNDDIVGAVSAAIHVLKGEPAPAPFNFKDKKEALRLLAHYAGDIHQPLHVGAVYLDAKGKRVNPDTGTFDAHTETRGGNRIKLTGTHVSFHSTWDAVPASLKVSHLNDTLLNQAKTAPASTGDVFGWPKQWADDTLSASQQAFKGLRFVKLQSADWNVTLPAKYSIAANSIKVRQVSKAGARLAGLLQAIWP